MLCVSFRSIIDHRFLTHFLFYVCLVECKYYILTNVCSQGRQHQHHSYNRKHIHRHQQTTLLDKAHSNMTVAIAVVAYRFTASH